MQFIREIPGFCSHFRDEIIARHRSCIDKLQQEGSTLYLACQEILTSAVFFKAEDRSYVPKDKQGRLYYIDKTPEEFKDCKVTILDPIGVSSNAPLVYTFKHLIKHYMAWKSIKGASKSVEGEKDYRVGLSSFENSPLYSLKLTRAILDHFYSKDSVKDFTDKLKLNASDLPPRFFHSFIPSSIPTLDSVEYENNEALMKEEDIRQAEVHIFHLMRDKPTYFADSSDDEDDDTHEEGFPAVASDDETENDDNKQQTPQAEVRKRKKNDKKKRNKKSKKTKTKYTLSVSSESDNEELG